MPIYEFECRKCEKRFEKLCGMSAGSNGVSCPDCGGTEVRKLISSFYAKGVSGGSKADCGGCHKSSCAGCH